jgi:hypothetical protein
LPPCRVDVQFSRFQNESKQACKRHRTFLGELQAFFTQLEQECELGQRVPNTEDLHVRKIRLGVPREKVAERDGYRIIVQVLTVGNETVGRCISVYYKPDTANLHSAEIIKRIKKAQAQEQDRKASTESQAGEVGYSGTG